MPVESATAREASKAASMSGASLKELAVKLLANGPHKLETTPRRVRALFDGAYILDTLEPRHVWEHPYYPQFYIPSAAVKNGTLTNNDAVDKDDSAFLATFKGKTKSTDRVISFAKGPLAGLVRFEFSALDAWFEEDQQIYGHPKDPYKRIEVLPTSRKITAKIDGVTIAESSNNQFLHETMLRTRYYMPLSAANYEYLTPSETTTMCPYKGTANYFNVVVNGKEHKDVLWYYRYPTAESAPIAGHMCFYNEKVDIYVDGVLEKK